MFLSSLRQSGILGNMATEKPSFVHLHTHSHYSLLDGLSKVDEMVALAKKYGMNAIGLTDHGNMYGAIDFYKTCKKADIKPIIGLEAYVTPGSRHSKLPGIDTERFHLTLLAKNEEGYKNLIRLVTISNLEGFYYKPRIDKEVLRKYSSGLICLSGCFGGELSRAIRRGDIEEAEKVIREHQEIFGKENYFLEIMHHPGVEGIDAVRAGIIALGKKFNIPLVATQDSHYLHSEDQHAHETLLAIQTNGDLKDENRFSMAVDDFSFINTETALEHFKDTPEAVWNTQKIADMCNIELTLGSWVFPDLKVENGSSYDDELKRLVYEGIAMRELDPKDTAVIDRIEYETKVIRDKGYAPYFLVVGDLLRYAREHNILTNIRGSVAGSITTYLLGITNVNPLEYNLPFERFLNPERPSAPDIDMDYADNRRDEVINYVREKYGSENVAQIGTFGTMMARGAVRDVARALGHPYAIGDRLSRLIPEGSQGFPMTINTALSMVPELNDLYKNDTTTTEIINLAKRLEGCVRHISVHAAGVVIAPKPLYEFAPTQLDPKGGKIITQYDMHAIEDAGLLKFDFLGIRNLSILGDAVRLVKERKDISIDLDHIPLDDTRTFEMLARGETMGLFQLNGAGMTRYLKELRPTTIHDINAMVALYRPGPMESIPEYIRRKHNPSVITYLDPRLKDILSMSYGVITYQDDVMMIAIHLAGYSWLSADKLRKAMGKKIPAEMQAQKEKLLQGFMEYGKLSKKKAEGLWLLIEPFAAYGFNKCLTGDTRIVDTKTGALMTMQEAYEKNRVPQVSTMDKKMKLFGKTVTSIMENGVKEVFTLTTRTGKNICATGNHPFYTISGWKNLSDLAQGDRIATSRTLAHIEGKKYDSHKAGALGYLLSEGNLCHPHGIYFYSSKDEEIRDFITHAKHFKNIKFTLDRSKSTVAVYCGQSDQKNGNTLDLWIRDIELKNKKATENFIPVCVYKWDKKTLAILLGKMWQGDGCVSIKNEQVYYATSSGRLANDVAHILLRIGIVATIHTKQFAYRGTHKKGYTVNICHRENLRTFASTAGVHLIGTKKRDLTILVKKSSHLATVAARGTKDIIPAEIMNGVRKIMNTRGITVAEISKKTGLSARLFSKDKKKIGYQREVVKIIGKALHAPEIIAYAESDIYWDEIVTIKKSGEKMTYDITLPPHHNFVGNDIIVHNSHAASYGQLAYQTAYMKANFPVEYMTAILTAESGDTEKIAEIISESKRMGIPILPPDVNASFGGFTIVNKDDKEEIRFGLYTIKNLGTDISDAIIAEREAKGAYKSLADFLERIRHKNLNKKSYEALVMSGAMDGLGERGAMLANTEEALAYNRAQGGEATGQISLFGGMSDQSTVPSFQLKPSIPATKKDMLMWEKELLGLFVSGHPLDAHREKLEAIGTTIEKIKTLKDGNVAVAGGIVENVHTIITKKGDKMAFVTLTDMTDSLELVLFPEIFFANKEFFETPDRCIKVKGKISERNGEKTLIVERVKEL
ncbi:MAG: DNA polymerase III subunit alpha [Candidatus Yonathbacteria bacterium]|nr:DNA polymerase III subunit alpha [Candidatus Yonathbacteria bacterium]